MIYPTPEGEKVAAKIKSLLKDMYTQVGQQMNTKHMEACMKHLSKLNEIFDQI